MKTRLKHLNYIKNVIKTLFEDDNCRFSIKDGSFPGHLIAEFATDVGTYISDSIKPLEYDLHIPFLIGGNISYNNRLRNNTTLGTLTKQIKENVYLCLQEVAFLKNRNRMDLVSWEQGGWISNKPFKIKTSDLPDDAFYCKVSDLVEVEVIRGINIGLIKSKREGFNGFNALNGALQNLVSKYCVFSEKPNWHRRGSIIYNRPYDYNITAKLVDMSCVPQNEEGNVRAALVHGVRIDKTGKLYSTKKSLSKSYILSTVPFSKFMNAMRLTVSRALSQALKLYNNNEVPIVKSAGAANVPGINVLTLRDPNYPQDSFKISKNLARKLLSVQEVTYEIVIPPKTNIVWYPELCKEEELKAQMFLSKVNRNNEVQKGDVLFHYYRVDEPLGGNLEACLNAFAKNEHKKCVTKYSSRKFFPVSYNVREGYERRTGVGIVEIKGYKVIEAAIGTKMSDRQGNKGTINQIVPDNKMPTIRVSGAVNHVDLVYNPPIYKRKIAFAYKCEEIQGLYGYVYGAPVRTEDFELEDLKTLLDHTKKMRLKTEILTKDGFRESFRIGVHFFAHLDHDPVEKFRYGNFKPPKATMMERKTFDRYGISFPETSEKLNQFAETLNVSVEIKGDLVIVKSLEEKTKEEIKAGKKITRYPNRVCTTINKKLKRNILSEELSLIPYRSLDNTVADPYLRDQWCKVRTSFGDIVLPPAVMAPYENEWGGITITPELKAINAIIAEQSWLDFKKRIEPNNYLLIKKIESKVKYLVNRFGDIMKKCLAKEARELYFARNPGVKGVAVCDDNLDLDTVCIPIEAYRWAAKHGYSTNFAALKRDPVHRIYNSPSVRIKPYKGGKAIKAHPDLLRMLDGDSDGDDIYIVFIKGIDVDTALKYLPSRLILGHTDISFKKKAHRTPASSAQGWAQSTLKKYTAIAGSCAINLYERASVMGVGLAEVGEIYHFMAQTALNFKHLTNNLTNDINIIHDYLVAGNYATYSQALQSICRIWPDVKHSKKKMRRLKMLFQFVPESEEETSGLRLIRKRAHLPENIEVLYTSQEYKVNNK